MYTVNQYSAREEECQRLSLRFKTYRLLDNFRLFLLYFQNIEYLSYPRMTPDALPLAQFIWKEVEHSPL
jgi:hypothetical protein